MTIKDGITNYLDFLRASNHETIADLTNYCTPDIHFRDPFNDVRSADHFVAIMEESYEKLFDMSFKILETFWSNEGAIIKWDFCFRMKLDGPLETITGLSEVRANEAGLITSHLDYWDSGERIYARIPIIGYFVRLIRNRVSAGLNNG